MKYWSDQLTFILACIIPLKIPLLLQKPQLVDSLYKDSSKLFPKNKMKE